MDETVRAGLDEMLVHFQELEDPRSTINQLHPLESVVVIAILGVLAGASGPKAVQRARPKLILTDLVMPGLDGMGLLSEVRRQWPEIPVILMTAYGNEEVALHALRAGAVSYVPKSQLAPRLLDTVLQVLQRIECEQDQHSLAGVLRSFNCEYVLKNDSRLIRPLVKTVQQTLGGMGCGDATDRIRLGVAMEEALDNALRHGTQGHGIEGSAAERGVLVHLKVSIEGAARILIRDDGPGFDPLSAGPQDLMECFDNGRHRGMTLIQALTDEVTFNARGNQVTLVKRLGQKVLAN